MRYRRTDAAGTRGSAAAAAAAAAAVVAVFVPAAGRRWMPAAAARTPRRQNCPTTAGWRPGGPPPWPAWPGPWSWLGYLSKSDERIRMFVAIFNSTTCWSRQCANAVGARVTREATERRFRDQTATSPQNHENRTHDDTTTTCCHVLKFKHAFKADTGSKEQEPFSVAAARESQRYFCARAR